jgi:RNA polymerase sigma-70 factor (ECF subfamily)
MPPDASTPTALLHAWRDGDREALDRLMPIIYDELARMAKTALRGERPGHTLETRSLIHEAYLRLIDANVDVNGRAHFLALAARTMRRVLTDHARGRQRDKRGGADRVRVSLTGIPAPEPEDRLDAIDLDAALVKLEAQDERRARVVELHFYGGLSFDETAEAMGLSKNTVGRDLRVAKAWLRRELAAPERRAEF